MKLRMGIATVCLAVVLPLSSPRAAPAQSASELLSRYSEIYQDRLDGIDDLYMVQSVLGMTTSTYFEKTMVDGNVVLQPRMVETGGNAMPLEDGSMEQLWGDPSAYLVEFAERATIDGTESVDGEETTVLRIDDLSDLELSAPGQGQNQTLQQFQPRSMRMFLDTNDWVVRRMETVADATTANGNTEVTADVAFSDFRDVAGLPYPHHIVVSVAGLEGAVSQEELEQARASLEELRSQLEAMPEAQREMVENMMGEQMEQFMETLESGSMTMDVTIDEVRVNEGPPEA